MISGTTRVAAVLGWPVEHSRSPALLNAAFAATGLDAVMVPIGVAPEGLAAVVAGLRAMRALGASVTVPHKLAVAALCDTRSAAADAIGAVNCVELAGDQLIGHNTDADGFVDGLAAAGFSGGGRVVVLGAGGAARAVAHGVTHALTPVAREVIVVARRPAAVDWTRARPWERDVLRDLFARATLVVDCTSLGLGGADEQATVEALPLDALPVTATVATLIYHRATRLLTRAAAAGHPTLDGRGMLVHQAARAFAIWTGQPAPIELMTQALTASLAPAGT